MRGCAPASACPHTRAASPWAAASSSSSARKAGLRVALTRAVEAELDLPGPINAFVPGMESEARRTLFNRIAPVYDEVGGWEGVIRSL